MALAYGASLGLQLLVAYYFGHWYDIRVFMAAGYLVATGLNPYAHYDLSQVFHHPLFQEPVPGIGYPPPWPLLLGAIYRLVYAPTGNFFLYNLAVKLPVIGANLALAHTTAATLKAIGGGERKVAKAELFILFNPLIIYTTAAWGQFDTVVALLALVALKWLFTHRWWASAPLLGLALALKPIVIPLLLLPYIHLARERRRLVLPYLALFTGTVLIAGLAPFPLLGWSLEPILAGWNAHFTVGGGMSLLTLIELAGSYKLPAGMEWLGFLWAIPLLAAYYLVWRRGIGDLREAITAAITLILIFYLTRSWLSEQNVDLLLPLMVIAAYLEVLSEARLTQVWVITLLFSILNVSTPQILYPALPQALELKEALDRHIYQPRIIARGLIVIPWQLVGWRIVKETIGRSGRLALGVAGGVSRVDGDDI
jgi:hypothetical protein